MTQLQEAQCRYKSDAEWDVQHLAVELDAEREVSKLLAGLLEIVVADSWADLTLTNQDRALKLAHDALAKYREGL